jgi:hypothetical protein
MERRIGLSNLDLDQAEALIAERVPRWSAWGLIVSPPTWMDDAADWPRPLLLERREVHRPMSLGLQVEGQAGFVFAQFVLYAGGWADADYLPPGTENPISEYVELDDAAQFGQLLDRVVDQLRSGEPAPPGTGRPGGVR